MGVADTRDDFLVSGISALAGSDLARTLRDDMSESEFDDICIDANEELSSLAVGGFYLGSRRYR